MGVFVQAIPTLEGVTAEQFIKKLDQNLLRKNTRIFIPSFGRVLPRNLLIQPSGFTLLAEKSPKAASLV